jgi:hypothetical protein
MNPNLHTITNDFADVRLLSLASWRQANEIYPRDRGGPYVVMQEGYDPDDLTMTADEFIIGRSGKWLSIGYFFRMPIAERRAEFVFGTAGEIMQMMSDLPSKVQMLRPGSEVQKEGEVQETDEMFEAYKAGKSHSVS